MSGVSRQDMFCASRQDMSCVSKGQGSLLEAIGSQTTLKNICVFSKQNSEGCRTCFHDVHRPHLNSIADGRRLQSLKLIAPSACPRTTVRRSAHTGIIHTTLRQINPLRPPSGDVSSQQYSQHTAPGVHMNVIQTTGQEATCLRVIE